MKAGEVCPSQVSSRWESSCQEKNPMGKCLRKCHATTKLGFYNRSQEHGLACFHLALKPLGSALNLEEKKHIKQAEKRSESLI